MLHKKEGQGRMTLSLFLTEPGLEPQYFIKY